MLAPVVHFTNNGFSYYALGRTKMTEMTEADATVVRATTDVTRVVTDDAAYYAFPSQFHGTQILVTESISHKDLRGSTFYATTQLTVSRAVGASPHEVLPAGESSELAVPMYTYPYCTRHHVLPGLIHGVNIVAAETPQDLTVFYMEQDAR